ncbi:MAG: methyltransferase [Planctomycetota bacterium]
MSMASRERIEKLSSGFMPARVLLTGVELKVFDAIGKKSLSAAEVAKLTRTHAESMERLLNALVGLGVLNKKGDEFQNTPSSLTHLIEEAPEPLLHIMQHRGNMWQTWSHLDEIVKTGHVPERRRTKKTQESFIKGMADVGILSAAATARLLKHELTSAGRLLDVGGGPAVYACEFARHAPNLKVTVFDLPGPLAIARETIRCAGLQSRVKVKEGDVLKSPSLGAGYDLVFMSNLIHSFKRPVAADLIRKAAKAMKKSGHMIIKDFYIKRQGTAPVFSALFSINMLVADAGDCFTRTEVEQWMTDAGIKPAGFVPVAKASALLLGVKI